MAFNNLVIPFHPMIKNYTISWNQQFIKNNVLYIIGESQLNPKKVLEKKLRGGAGQAGVS